MGANLQAAQDYTMSQHTVLDAPSVGRERLQHTARAASVAYPVAMPLKNRGSKTRVLILGSGTLADQIVATLAEDRSRSRFHLVGRLDTYDLKHTGGGDRMTGGPHTLEEVVAREQVEKVVVAMSERRNALPIDQLLKLKVAGIRVEDGTAFYERVSGKIGLAGLKPSSLVFSEGFRWTDTVVKRVMDILLAAVGLILATPLFILLPTLIKLESRGPVLYRQVRVGMYGRPFMMFKFRSMRQDAEVSGKAIWAQQNDPRVTRFGRMLRKYRFDELPQLFNVLVGDMSVVGPRPERPEFVESLRRVIPFYALRLATKPGITGWAQVMFPYGASENDAAEKLQYDMYYLKHMSVGFDCRITFKPIRTVLCGSGAR